jgi:hypothetical protein
MVTTNVGTILAFGGMEGHNEKASNRDSWCPSHTLNERSPNDKSEVLPLEPIFLV